jgi:hypothetical protein
VRLEKVGGNEVKPIRTPDEALARLGELYLQRHSVYGSTNEDFGKVFMAFFPAGVEVRDEETANRLALFNHVADKLARYARQFANGGHEDSLDDVSIYAQLLQEYDKKCLARAIPSARVRKLLDEMIAMLRNDDGGLDLNQIKSLGSAVDVVNVLFDKMKEEEDGA